MTANRWAALIADLELELTAISRLASESERILRRAPEESDEVYVRAAASLLQDFYSGTEKLMQRIAEEIDGALPAGPRWHAQLLARMTASIEGVRPAVLGPDLAESLDEYLRFRHVVRAIYGYSLKWERCRELLREMPGLVLALTREMRSFEDALRSLPA